MICIASKNAKKLPKSKPRRCGLLLGKILAFFLRCVWLIFIVSAHNPHGYVMVWIIVFGMYYGYGVCYGL